LKISRAATRLGISALGQFVVHGLHQHGLVLALDGFGSGIRVDRQHDFHVAGVGIPRERLEFREVKGLVDLGSDFDASEGDGRTYQDKDGHRGGANSLSHTAIRIMPVRCRSGKRGLHRFQDALTARGDDRVGASTVSRQRG